MAKPTPTAVETELRKKTKIKPKKGEDRDDYLTRLQEAVDALKDDDWEDLSDGAQKWANKAAEASQKKKPMPEFSADKKAKDEGAEDDDEEEEEEEGKAKGGKKTKASAEKKTKGKTGKDKSADEGEKRPRDLKERIKLAMLENTDLTVDEIQAMLEKQGKTMPTRNTIAGIASEFRHSLRVLKKAGKLRGVSI